MNKKMEEKIEELFKIAEFSEENSYDDLIRIEWENGIIGHIPVPIVIRRVGKKLFRELLGNIEIVLCRDTDYFSCPYCERKSFYAGHCEWTNCIPSCFDIEEREKREKKKKEKKDYFLQKWEEKQNYPNTVDRVLYVTARSDLWSFLHTDWKHPDTEKTALHLLVGNTVLWKKAAKFFSNIDVKDNGGQTPLHCAVLEGNLDLCKYLVSVGADVNAKTNYADTPLHLSGEHPEICKYLVSVGADVNAKNESGRLPIHNICKYNNVESAHTLIEVGRSRFDTIDKSGFSPLGIAENFGSPKIVAYLKEK